MKLINQEITINELKIMAEKMFGNLVKAVVDIERGLMAVDAELHADEEALKDAPEREGRFIKVKRVIE